MLPEKEQVVDVPDIYVLMYKDGPVWRICQHGGSSTRMAPMIYDSINSAHRGRGRHPGSVIVKLKSQKGEIDAKI